MRQRRPGTRRDLSGPGGQILMPDPGRFRPAWLQIVSLPRINLDVDRVRVKVIAQQFIRIIGYVVRVLTIISMHPIVVK